MGRSPRVILDPDDIVLARSATMEVDDTDPPLVSTTTVTGDDLAGGVAAAAFTTERDGEFLDGAAFVEVGVVGEDDVPQGLWSSVFSRGAGGGGGEWGTYRDEGEARTGVPLQDCALVLFRGRGTSEHHLLFFVCLWCLGRVQPGRQACGRDSAAGERTGRGEGGAAQGGHGGEGGGRGDEDKD